MDRSGRDRGRVFFLFFLSLSLSLLGGGGGGGTATQKKKPERVGEKGCDTGCECCTTAEKTSLWSASIPGPDAVLQLKSLLLMAQSCGTGTHGGDNHVPSAALSSLQDLCILQFRRSPS